MSDEEIIDGKTYKKLPFPQKELKITVDTSTVEELAKKKQAVEAKEQELNAKLEKAEAGESIFEDIHSKLRDEFEEHGLPCPKVENSEDLNNAVAILKGLKAKGDNPASGGSATLEGQYGQQNNQGFSSHEELIDNIRDLASASNKDLRSRAENQKILDTLMTKAVLGQRETNKPFSYSPKEGDKSPLEMLRDKFQRRKRLAQGES
jgi:hypothetical protein